MIKSINPATEQIVETYDALNAAGIESALTLAKATSKYWTKTELSTRVSLVHALADTLEKTANTSALLMTKEMGKTIAAGKAEIDKCIKYCRYTADMAHDYLADEVVETQYKQSFTRPQPLGTILLVMPWNFPFWQVIRVAVAAILAGNTCLLKHASNVPGCALEIEKIFIKSGFPKGVFQTLLIASSAVKSILEDGRVHGASVTGSEHAGSSVASICGTQIKPCVLELGGSDPFIVMPSANLAGAISHAITGRMRNNGQSCIAAKRLIVHADIYDDFKAGFIATMNEIKIGDPLDEKTGMGPISSKKAQMEITEMLHLVERQGAEITTGTQKIPKIGYYLRPSILENVRPNMDIYDQEIFGPAAMLFKVNSINEAISLANDIPLGLSSVLFSNDEAEQKLAINELQSGSTYINRYASSDIRMPFGGTKRSGFGREIAKQGLREFTNLKTVIIAN